MLKNTNVSGRGWLLGAAALAMLCISTAANADHGRRHRGGDAELDIDARLNFDRGQPRMDIRIDAEIERRRLDQYHVVVTISPAAQGFGGHFVQPQTVLISLDRPTDIDDDEIEFSKRVSMFLPRHLVRFGDSLIVHAELVSSTTGRVLDRTQTIATRRVEQFPRHPRGRIGRPVIW